ncbi:hypothetical protein Y032_0018g3565 [Ancylostoma ceylanicum]|uniref:Uncharacterized protein n=1 Tax=Ancylostoma ceylanicum TaxID=53326 RepID=A0A016V535_9BILA|nr:hypothetical protein Y032_0018g3565 [Ancylostoma ceylanicum]
MFLSALLNLYVPPPCLIRPLHPFFSYFRLFSPISGIRMKVTTSYPVIHLYGAKHLKCKGKQGEDYGSGKGLAIEAQFHTAALNYVGIPEF